MRHNRQGELILNIFDFKSLFLFNHFKLDIWLMGKIWKQLNKS
jgi:hypothetical protein